MKNENREIKSSVFADLFGDDEKDGIKNFLSLYNAIHDTNLKIEDTVIEHKKIPQSIYKTFNNDVSMLINGKLIVLLEHQSTPNENMPLRCLEYYVHLLYGIIPADVRYRQKLYKIPTPEFYVFYNGVTETKQEYTMKLSDAFLSSQTEPLCELKVKFIKINGKGSQNLPVIKKCDILKQYCEFMDIVLRYQTKMKSQPTSEEMQGCYERAIHEAISRGILADYLNRKGTEVINMFFGEYDYELDMKVKAEEAMEQGMAEGMAKGMAKGLEKGFSEGARKKTVELAKNLINMKLGTPEQIAQASGLTLNQVLELQKL